MNKYSQEVQNILRTFFMELNANRSAMANMGKSLSAELDAEVKNPEVFLKEILSTVKTLTSITSKVAHGLQELNMDLQDAGELCDVMEWDEDLCAKLDDDLVATRNEYLLFKEDLESGYKENYGKDADPLMVYLTETGKLEYFFELLSNPET
jgi:hypothetical protein